MIKKSKKQNTWKICPVCCQRIDPRNRFCPYCNAIIPEYEIGEEYYGMPKKKNKFIEAVLYHKKKLFIGCAAFFVLLAVYLIGRAAYIHWQDANTVIGMDVQYTGDLKNGAVIDSDSPFKVTVLMRNGDKKEVDDWVIEEPVKLEKGTISGVEISYRNKTVVYTLGEVE